MSQILETEYPILTIDTNSRKIIIPKAPTTEDPNPEYPAPWNLTDYPIAIAGDEKSNALVFNIPKNKFDSNYYLAAAAKQLVYDLRDDFVEDEEESKPDIYIRCLNAKNQYSEFAITNNDITYEGDLLQFSWVLGAPVTDYAGTFTFSIVFKVIQLTAVNTQTGMTYVEIDDGTYKDEDGQIYHSGEAGCPDFTSGNFEWYSTKSYQWQTLTCSLTIAESLYDEKQYVRASTQDEFYYEVFAQIADLRARIVGSGGSGSLTRLQPKTLSNAITIGDVECSTVEQTLGEIANTLNNIDFIVTSNSV